MDKIIGFKITPNKLKSKIDIFDIGLQVKTMKKNGYNIFLWGIGNLDNCIINKKFTLSFPVTESLNDRNILISIDNEKIIIENDWLGSIPIFYNVDTNEVSTLLNEIISDKEISKQGFNNFLEFGYSVFEETPVDNIKFLRYLSKIVIEKNKIQIIRKKDIVKENLKFNSSEDKIFEKIIRYININNDNVDNYIIPTSGGFDSRILNICIKDKKKIRAYTYGVSKKQLDSFESVHAKKLCEILNIEWSLIELSDFNKYINEWYSIFGVSTHLHGMYQIEFYQKISQISKGVLISGIVGDAWAGKVLNINIKSSKDLVKLGYTHGLNCDASKSKVISSNQIKEKYIKDEKEIINSKLNSVALIRNKIILLSYLLTVPEYMGFPTVSPFLNFDIAMSMLSISDERRENRKWQREFFKMNNVDLEEMNLNKNNINTLDLDILKKSKLKKLDCNIFNKFISKDYIHFINKNIDCENISKIINLKYDLLYVPKIGGILRRMNVKDNRVISYNAYRTLYALQKLFEE